MKFVFFANTDWYLYNFRLSTALQLKLRGAEVVMLSPPGSYGARFAEHGIRWVTLAMNRASLNPLREAWALQQLVRILQAERPDLLHNFTVKCAVYGALAARVAKVPAVVNAVAGMGYVFTSNRLKARALRPVVKLLMRNTIGGGHSRLIVQNPDDAEALTASRLVSPLKIRLIRSSGVDTFRFCPPPQHVPRPRTLRVVLAARLLWEKGIREFVEAANLLKQQGRDIQFFLAGTPDSGNPSAVGLSDVQDWQDRGLVTWLGHVDDMPALLHSADVMVLPSYYREGVPKCLIEGAACGLALISTNLPGCREVIERHGVDGLHVEPRNANALAALLARLDDDRELLRQLGDCARQKALAQFDERLVIESTIAVYGELLREPLRAVEPAA
jgi:glycosyltransferase involved in cell wall biosynthesis